MLDGKHDDLPESAFFLKGGIDDVVESAKGSSKKDDSDKDDSDEEKKDDDSEDEDDS